MDKELKHYGTQFYSGRYPWGSGENPYQRSGGWRAHVQALRDQGFTDNEIAKFEGLKTHEFRARMTVSKDEVRAHKYNQAVRLKEKGYSDTAIGKKMGINESSVRSLLDPARAERAAITKATINMLQENVEEHRFIDVGAGIESNLGISRTKLNTAVSELKERGYQVHLINLPQQGIPGQFTRMKVLGAPDTQWRTVVQDPTVIKNITARSPDYGRSYPSALGLQPIQSVSSARIAIRYGDEGGAQKDGIIELRRGAKDLDLGASRYAQVRIGVDDTHFLKGMAIYNDNLPAGVDIMFNTNKQKSASKLDVMKKMKDNPDNPFGSTIKRVIDETGQSVSAQRGAINIVNEEGDWNTWSRTISSQILSKQSTPLAKQQLGIALKEKQDEYAEIMATTNPVVRKKLLTAFGDDCDSSSVHLKAAALPRQVSKVLLPIPDMKTNEVYAPTFNNGETVVLIRHPHAGTFEIPELTVNNRSIPAQKVMKGALDAVGIHPQVAQKLSGADFDGDAVIIIPKGPNQKRQIQTSPSLKGLKDFDPISTYPPYDGMKTIDGGIYNAKTKEVVFPKDANGHEKKPTQLKQVKMGEVSNLITDMTIKGANLDEVARAVRHSMVVIDSEKHHLDYKLSYSQNGISALSERYQNSSRGGASTLISRAGSEIRVDHRRTYATIDPKTGAKVYAETGQTYHKPVGVDKETGKKIYDSSSPVVKRQTVSTQMAETTDAYTLSSGRPVEEVYAAHANALKTLGNTARLEAEAIVSPTYSPSARVTYSKEVASLNASLEIAKQNKPLERQAQILAGSVVDRQKEASPYMDKDDIKKLTNQALAAARVSTGAKKSQIIISDSEWVAIQAGAISASKLSQILENADLNRVKQLATPRSTTEIPTAKINRAKTMVANGYTLAEISEQLGVSTSALSRILN